MTYEQKHAILVFLSLAYLTQNDDLQFHPLIFFLNIAYICPVHNLIYLSPIDPLKSAFCPHIFNEMIIPLVTDGHLIKPNSSRSLPNWLHDT
jgi:hypothetical protein